jgi:hypothetical protein
MSIDLALSSSHEPNPRTKSIFDRTTHVNTSADDDLTFL